MVPLSMVLALGAASARAAHPADNGLGRTPPMGWTSWTTAWMNPNQTYMEATMASLVKPRAGGVSLAGLGYTFVGLDDFWQACGAGVNGSFHDTTGSPLVNLTRFPSMKDMTAFGHTRGLSVGWYMNNCGCKEETSWQGDANIDLHYHGDVNALLEYEFDAAKFDGCGEFEDLTRWATLINETKRPMMIENCHWGGDGPHVMDDATGELWCPYNVYRAGADIVPDNWASFLANLQTLNAFLSKQQLAPPGPGNWPLSKPGCWAYPDSVQTGQYARLEEDRTNFGAWAVTSSPLILGMNVVDESALDRVWDIVSNEVAIQINQAWAGHPGRLVRETHRTLADSYPRAVECSGSSSVQGDWELGPVDAVRNNTRFIRSKRTGLCVDAWAKNPLKMEVCTGNASQRFTFDGNDGEGTIKAPMFESNEGELNGCFDVNAKHGPDVQLTRCYGSPNDAFTFDARTGVWADRGTQEPFPRRCMEVQNGTVAETQVFAKPQPDGGVAVFAFNAGRLHRADSPALTLDLAEDLNLPAGKSFRMWDVWARRDISEIVVGSLHLAPIPDHDSTFLLLIPIAPSARNAVAADTITV